MDENCVLKKNCVQLLELFSFFLGTLQILEASNVEAAFGFSLERSEGHTARVRLDDATRRLTAPLVAA